MKKHLIVAVLSLGLSLGACSSNTDRNEAGKQIEKALAFSSVMKERERELYATHGSTPEIYGEKQKVLDAEKEAFNMPQYYFQAIELMDADASGEVGFNAMKLIAEEHNSVLASRDKAEELELTIDQIDKVFIRVIENALSEHINNPSLIELVDYPLFNNFMLNRGDKNKEDYDYQKSVLNRILKESENRSIRAFAAYRLTDFAVRTAQIFEQTEELKRQAGMDITTYSEMALNDYADVVVKGKTVKDRVEGKLLSLTLTVGQELPNVEAKNLEGELDQLSNYRGKVILVDFWATWCQPCIAAFPMMADLKQELAGKPFEIVSISVDSEVEDAIEFKENSEVKMSWVNWHIGPDSPTLTKWSVTQYPTFFVLDENGIIQSTSFDGKKIKELVNKTAK